MRNGHLVVVGDCLLDRDVEGTVSRVSPDAPVPVLDEAAARRRPGGAALAAALAAEGTRPVTLVTAIADDPAGAELRRLVEASGVEVICAEATSPTPEKVRFLAGGHPLLRLDRGGPPGPPGALPPEAVEAVAGAGVVLVSDYGRGVAGHEDLRGALAGRRRPTVWDPHPRGPEPVAGTTVVTPNRAELQRLAPAAAAGDGSDLASLVAAARLLVRRWRCGAVVVTVGADGAVVVQQDGPPMAVPGQAAAGDPCGAGDSFAAAVATALLQGSVLTEAVAAAVARAGRFVAGGGARGWAVGSAGGEAGHAGTAGVAGAGAAPGGGGMAGGGAGDPYTMSAEVRRAGGRVVVAGGCFDLLHAGHVDLLQNARRLGDCLIVAMNSDRSVRRIKGPGRPVVGEADRVAMLSALGCVDGVAVFDEDSPLAVLRRLRPHVFAKGGDYSSRHLPEEDVVAEWGGQVVVLPYLDGRSTTALLGVAGATR